jgi:hypothetical protein
MPEMPTIKPAITIVRIIGEFEPWSMLDSDIEFYVSSERVLPTKRRAERPGIMPRPPITKSLILMLVIPSM